MSANGIDSLEESMQEEMALFRDMSANENSSWQALQKDTEC